MENLARHSRGTYKTETIKIFVKQMSLACMSYKEFEYLLILNISTWWWNRAIASPIFLTKILFIAIYYNDFKLNFPAQLAHYQFIWTEYSTWSPYLVHILFKPIWLISIKRICFNMSIYLSKWYSVKKSLLVFQISDIQILQILKSLT